MYSAAFLAIPAFDMAQEHSGAACITCCCSFKIQHSAVQLQYSLLYSLTLAILHEYDSLAACQDDAVKAYHVGVAKGLQP
jgi:hypothetical protein